MEIPFGGAKKREEGAPQKPTQPNFFVKDY